MNKYVLLGIGLLIWTLGSCSRPSRFGSEQVQREATANRFERIDHFISEGKTYQLLNVSDGLSKVGSKQAVDRLMIIAANRNEAIRNVVLDHAGRLPPGQARRVLDVLALADDETGKKARERLNSIGKPDGR